MNTNTNISRTIIVNRDESGITRDSGSGLPGLRGIPGVPWTLYLRVSASFGDTILIRACGT